MSKIDSLDEAKRWLRSLSWSDAEKLSGLSAEEFKKYRASRGIASQPVTAPRGTPPAAEGRPFEHPYYWAAFILIGDPGD